MLLAPFQLCHFGRATSCEWPCGRTLAYTDDGAAVGRRTDITGAGADPLSPGVSPTP